MSRIHLFGRIVNPITSNKGQATYFEFKDYIHGCRAKTKPVIKPTHEEAEEYLHLAKKYGRGIGGTNQKEYNRYHKLKNEYDWRTQLVEENGRYGLVAPTGEIILPAIFQDVFTQFDAILSTPDLIPVYNGEAWGLVTPGGKPLLAVDFKYCAIIPECWGSGIFFVQEHRTRAWGALQLENTPSSISGKRSLRYQVRQLNELMPPIADEIYEDELFTECAPTIFWMVRKGDKVGILSQSGYSEIIYDTYETNDEECTFRLIRSDRKRAYRRSIADPSGKHIRI